MSCAGDDDEYKNKATWKYLLVVYLNCPTRYRSVVLLQEYLIDILECVNPSAAWGVTILLVGYQRGQEMR